MSEKMRISFNVDEALKEKKRLETLSKYETLSQRDSQLLSILNQWVSHLSTSHSSS